MCLYVRSTASGSRILGLFSPVKSNNNDENNLLKAELSATKWRKGKDLFFFPVSPPDVFYKSQLSKYTVVKSELDRTRTVVGDARLPVSRD